MVPGYTQLALGCNESFKGTDSQKMTPCHRNLKELFGGKFSFDPYEKNFIKVSILGKFLLISETCSFKVQKFFFNQSVNLEQAGSIP